MLAIGRADLRAAVTLPDAIDSARTAFVTLSSDRGTVPARHHLTTIHGTSLIMPAYASDLSTLGVKVVTVTPGNPQVDRPTVQGIVILVDEESGSPVALLEGTYLTQLRTGAAIGFAADLLARQDARRITVFGAGPIAQMSLAAVCAVREIEDVRIVNRNRDRFDRFVATIQDLAGASCPRPRWVESPTEALHESDIVVTATGSATPVFPGDALAPGAFVGAVGAYNPATRELDLATVQRSRFIIDTRAGALQEAGELAIPIARGELTEEHIWAEIGEVALGKRQGRSTAEDIIVFKSVGNALQDLVLATLVFERAQARGLGRAIDLT